LRVDKALGMDDVFGAVHLDQLVARARLALHRVGTGPGNDALRISGVTTLNTCRQYRYSPARSSSRLE
jgi:hypothetical protein